MGRISTYQENAVTTQSSGKLVVMIYDAAIRNLHHLISAMESKDFERKAKFLNKAMDIINELDCCLDMESGGDIAMNLRQLYGFMRRHLMSANIKMDTQMVREVIAILEDLNEGWKAIAT